MALFEGYERRIEKVNSVLNEYGIASLEEAKEIANQTALILQNREGSPANRVRECLLGLHCGSCHCHQKRMQNRARGGGGHWDRFAVFLPFLAR